MTIFYERIAHTSIRRYRRWNDDYTNRLLASQFNGRGPPGQIPRINITGREVIYQSPIVFTPLKDYETVDADKLNEIVRHEYAAAGVDPKQVETGAVIITGETAKKKNADEILRALSGLAGEFVVSVAGPNVESLIAGRGAGAAKYSQEHYTSVTNIDIGGGSANSVTFRSGNIVGAAAMNFGGRILEVEHGSNLRPRMDSSLMVEMVEPITRAIRMCPPK